MNNYSTFSGESGYLATITSLEENQFLVSLALDGWIGATDELVEGNWVWADGPETGIQFWQGLSSGTNVGGNFSNWGSGEPNNSFNEDYAHLSGGTWNDLRVSSTRTGYFVEYSSVSNVPAPTAIWLVGSGLIGLVGMRKKSAKLSGKYA